MKPSFALNLTEDGVTLLHRTARGWLDVGHTTFSDPDLPAALDYLRSTALGLAPKGIATKLVIPNSQILYTDVEAPGPGEDDRRAQIEAALVGRTPYAVEDLVYDWSGSGTTVRVAVVAKETLAEAEGFATEHRFNPVSFVAIPDGDFGGEPFFGLTAAASAPARKSEKVERDSEAIRIVTREIPGSEARAEAAQAQPAEAPPAPDPVPETAAAPPPEPAPEPAPAPMTAPVTAPLTVTEAVAEERAPAEAGANPPAAPAAKGQDADEAPMALDVAQDDVPPAPAWAKAPAQVDAPEPAERQAPSVLSDEVPPAPSSAALTAFASRRSAEAPFPPSRSAGVADPKVPPAFPSALSAEAPAGTTNVTAPTVPRPAGAKPPPEKPAPKQPKFSYDDPVPPPSRMPGDPPLATPAVTSTKSGKGLRNLVTSPSIPGTRNNKPGPARPAVTPGATSAAEVSPDSLGLGLGGRKAPQRGKPRFLGLILTGILLLLLAIVAGLSSVYLGANDPLDAPPAEVDVAALSADAPADPIVAPADIPAPDDEMLADLQDPADFAETAAEGEVAAPVDPVADIVAAEVSAEEAIPVAEGQATDLAALPDAAPAEAAPAEAEVAAPPAAEAVAEVQTVEPAPQTGLDSTVGTAAQPGPEGQDEIFLAGMDALPTMTDPLTLAAPATSGDTLPGPQMPPPPFGTVYQFDANGRIMPTPEGIATPEGVTLVSGKPAILPPPRPASVEAAATATVAPAAAEAASPASGGESAAEAAAAVQPAETFAADPALQSARPRTRPADLAPAASAGGEDDASLAPAEDSRFASLRPRLRPASILAAGEETRRASDAASLAVQAAASAAVAEATAAADTSPLAVSVSRVPAPRPRSLQNAVQAAVAAATQPSRTPTPEAEAPSKAAPEEEEDHEPEVATAAPRIPTRASVAKNATYVNAINLSQTNLIGVYGTQSKRYALIRQSNGRYKKVRVGDSVDGGRVQAITASEVRYQKGGRLVTLAMPRG